MACTRARIPSPVEGDQSRAIAFIVGCGRSGTTLLSRLLQFHPDAAVLIEPYERWAAVDPRTDVTHLFWQGEAQCFLEYEDCTDEMRARFARLFRPPARPGGWLIEKSPINAMRLRYLDALAPEAKFIHIIRDGDEVSRSIVEHAQSDPNYHIAGRHDCNLWWGCGDSKWKSLLAGAKARNFLPATVGESVDDRTRGVCEWISSLEAADQARDALQGRFHEVRYEELTDNPAVVLEHIARFLGIEPGAAWLQKARQLTRPARVTSTPMTLPAELVAPFNLWQTRLGYSRLSPVPH